MGYTTEFTGAVKLSRPLTLSEAKFILEMNGDSDVTKERWGMRNYLQWVPTETLDAIVWDGNEKFYDYVPLLQKLCDWLFANGVGTSGLLNYRGESSGDFGQIIVLDNKVTLRAGDKVASAASNPLTLERLGEIALEQLTSC